MVNDRIPSWDCFLMSMAYFISMRSKDESTHIGAVVVDDNHRPLSWGYNSFPMHIDDSLPERQERPEKYFWFEHAERNSIYLSGTRDLTGATMYTPGIPCMDCARAIVQAGIKKVVVHKDWMQKQKEDLDTNIWEENAKRSKQLFKEAGVKLEVYAGSIIREIVSKQRGIDILEPKDKGV